MAIIVDKIRIAYMPSPKVACTSLKTMFYRIENDSDFVPSIRNSIKFYIHGYYPTVPFARTPHERIRDHFKICVVRDPIRRFLSSYSNRVCFHKELNEKRLSSEAIKAGAIPNPNLEEFVERLEIYRKHSRSILHHTDPQTVFLGGDPNYYSRIYQMNELEDLRTDLSCRSRLDLSLPHVQNGGPKIEPESLSSNALEKVQVFYKKDYNTYSFSQ